MARGRQRSLFSKALFDRVLARIEQGEKSLAAIRAEGVSTSMFFRNLNLDEHRELKDVYARACDARDITPLEEEAYRRAVEGTEKPVYQKGEMVGTVREYSDQLLMFLLRARAPKIYAKPETVVSQTNVTQVSEGPPKRKRSKEEDLAFAERLKKAGVKL